MLWLMSSNPALRQEEAPTLARADEVLDAFVARFMNTADANDVYKKRLVKGARYTVVLNGPKGSDMDLWVWNPGTTEIFQFTAGCFSFDA